MNQIGMPVTQEMLDVKYIPMAEKIKLMARRSILPNIIGSIIMLFTVAGQFTLSTQVRMTRLPTKKRKLQHLFSFPCK